MSQDTQQQDAKTRQRAANVRLAWILASVALVFMLGFIAKQAVFG